MINFSKDTNPNCSLHNNKYSPPPSLHFIYKEQISNTHLHLCHQNTRLNHEMRSSTHSTQEHSNFARECNITYRNIKHIPETSQGVDCIRTPANLMTQKPAPRDHVARPSIRHPSRTEASPQNASHQDSSS